MSRAAAVIDLASYRAEQESRLRRVEEPSPAPAPPTPAIVWVPVYFWYWAV